MQRAPGKKAVQAPPGAGAEVDHPPLLLASASPRRRALLQAAGVPLRVLPAKINEGARPGERARALVLRLAQEKAEAAARGLGQGFALGADTVVAEGDDIFGKARDAAQARRMLERLAGRTHRVLSGVALAAAGGGGRTARLCVESRVRLRAAKPETLAAYVASGEWMDKAGAYALQGEGRHLVETTRGSRSNIIGLPLEETLALLGSAGIEAAPHGAGMFARYEALQRRMADAARRSGRSPEDITLVGAAKRQGAEVVAGAVLAGLCDIGENFTQELRDKPPRIAGLLQDAGTQAPRLHFIGRLQRSSLRHVAQHADVVHSIERIDVAAELDRRAGALGRRLEVLIQVNISAEPQKGGAEPQAVPELVAGLARFAHLRLCGLMAIPAPGPPETVRAAFAKLRKLQGAVGKAALPQLSMGMSDDFETAIAEGADMIRVGSALFGPRPA